MAGNIKCWGNPIIRVDLTAGSIVPETPEEKTRREFLIGRGLNNWLLFSEVEPGKTDPLSPDNVILFGSGLFIGTSFPGAVRTSFVSLNPFTKGYGESSSSGGFATELKKAGYDGVIVSGKSLRPVYLWIDDGHIELKDAANLIGKTTFEASAMIKQELGDENIETLTIGPAGEKVVSFANINCGNRYAGKCGMGAIMGSKNLKAVAVRGTSSVKLFDPNKFKKISNKIRSVIKGNPDFSSIAKTGFIGALDLQNEMGMIGTQNFKGAYFDRISSIGYDAIEKYYKRVIHCRGGCPVDCDRLIQIDEGDVFGGTWVSSVQSTPSYNFAHFLIDDINTVIKGFYLCNAYGLDIHAWSNVIQWAIECYERGILTREDTDKLDLRWNDGPLLLESIRRIAYREGKFGDLLADGVAIASRRVGRGSEKYAMQMKGMEIDDELRVGKGTTLGIITESRGPGHTLGAWFGEQDKSMTVEQSKKLYGTENAAKPQTYEDKADLVVHTERYGAVQDSLGICWFSTHRLAPQIIEEYNMRTYAELVEAATGWRVSEEELFQIAERILTIEKSINVLAGLTRRDDFPPDRFFEPIKEGQFKGMKLDSREIDKLLRRHDELHGWDPETGIPTLRTLEDLGLAEVADKLKALGKLD